MSNSARKACRCCEGSGSEADNLAIGREMAAMRQAAGIGLRELARSLCVSHSFLSQLENGQRRWMVALRRRYAIACGRKP